MDCGLESVAIDESRIPMYPNRGYATGYEEIVGQSGPYIEMLEGVGAVHPGAIAPWAPRRAYAAGYGVGQAAPPPHPAAMIPPPAPPPHMAHAHRPHFGGYPSFLPGGGVAYGGRPVLVERPLRDIREYPLGFFQSGIGVCVGAVDVVSRPQIVFRGERLVVPTGTASLFSLIDVKVGNRSQLANSTALPAQVFTETAVGVRLALDTAVVAQDIAITVENISSDNATFMAALIGTAAQ